MSDLRYLCLLAYSGVKHFLCLVCPMLPVSLDCLFLIATSVFSNVYKSILKIREIKALCNAFQLERSKIILNVKW